MPPLRTPARRERAFDLWLSCHTQDEVAEALYMPRQTVTDGKGLGHQTSASPIPFVLACSRGS